MKMHIVQKEKVAGKLKKGWRLASRPMDGGKMYNEMIEMLTSKDILVGGLAGESSISSKGNIIEADGDFSKHGYVFMIDENESSIVEELQNMFPEVEIQLIQDLLDTNKQNVDKTIDQLLQVTPTSKFVGELPPLPPRSTLSPQHQQSSHKKDTPCPECPVCYEPFTPPRRIIQCTNGHLVCESCHSKPQLKVCPTCKNVFMGRAIAMEQFLADLYQQ
eukprot:GFUD01003764.1.p1 GENE.GFUD01003764.1~~GFUD01003764.1.p1  ORF type:complete len:218 (+),score=51.52 GFUD01003764.1:460-1113(+)